MGGSVELPQFRHEAPERLVQRTSSLIDHFVVLLDGGQRLPQRSLAPFYLVARNLFRTHVSRFIEVF